MTSLAVILLLSSVVLFMAFLLNQNQIAQRQKIKTEGDNALKQIRQILREAKTIEGCSFSEEDSLTLRDLQDNQTTIEVHDHNQRLGLTDIAGNTTYLTGEDLTARNFQADCIAGHETVSVDIEFTLVNEKIGGLGQAGSQTFGTSVNLRN